MAGGRANNAAGVIRRYSGEPADNRSGYSPQRSIRPGAASGLAQQAQAIFLCEAGCGEVTVLTHAKRGMDRLEPL
ncbi:hypothetical protein EJU38_09630 [Pseudomonas aeruginosa]|nr:hypothetical protein EJU38_09630 [Pseudomonas aeruginosa]